MDAGSAKSAKPKPRSIGYGQVHMANLCVAMCFSVNGVSQLHGKILCDTLFHDYYLLDKKKFCAITNGITHRRWLLEANPALTSLITETIGDGFRTDASQLTKLMPFADDAAFREKFAQVKKVNKQRLQKLVKNRQNIDIDTDFIFDTQAKRLHEYKRQMLNALHIQVLYNRIMDDPNFTMTPRVFIFAAKASPGYYKAKLIIRYILALSKMINHNPRASRMLRIVFVENYDVSAAEAIMPATDLSEQLSTAGKEASGTGNMKFMMNGALTLGTLDGANVEMHQVLGDENMFLFGLTSDEAARLRQSYDPYLLYTRDPVLHRVLDQLKTGFRDGVSYEDLYQRLLYGADCPADQYLLLADFASYCAASHRVVDTYADREKWNRMSLHNIARSGIFSADRSIADYADTIWHVPYKK